MERQNSSSSESTSTDTILYEQPKSKKHRSLLDGTSMGELKELWEKLQTLNNTLQSMSWAEGLKPLNIFNSFDDLISFGGEKLLNELLEENKIIKKEFTSVQEYLHKNQTCKSLNYNMQPFIGVIYGPTGSGKSQLLRNLLSSQLIHPQPETIFFIVPQIDMIPPHEFSAWESQICEGNYLAGPDGIVIPQSSTLMPKFIKMSYDEFIQDHNYDISDPNNVFAQAAKEGPIAIIMDECMENLGSTKGIAKFFHAFPSKLHDKFPKCTGYTVLVVLHNMNPRKDNCGNIATLKIQAKMHILSPKMQPMQLNRFINTYTKNLPLAITLLLKDIFNYHNLHSKYDWIIYNTVPEHDALQWMYLNPTEGVMPMYLNVQCKLYNILVKIHKILHDRSRWNKYYHNKKIKI
ncbi:IVa2 [Bat mastadenovirus WIV13]|uniref:IVa2 n=1 Tax=Bat mastadenovirus WIV13 TaxID=1788435 RepID=A0A1B0UHW0_9ADEN|nr:IVa2 [Bat mastadenovirus WIV13]AMB43021.1 IVa2 [Bat mastadenovirus WIV13]